MINANHYAVDYDHYCYTSDFMNKFYDANLIYKAGKKAIAGAPFKYKSQLFEMNQLLETAQIQKAMIEKKYKPTKRNKICDKRAWQEKKYYNQYND